MTWIEKVKAFCDTYNIPYDYLAETLYEPKVIPMIRGKAFEFTALLALQNVLPASEFEVSKESMNAQLGSHDIDVAVYHKPTQITISVECKLSAKGSYRYSKQDNHHSLRVKCMRSRTLGEAMIAQQSSKLNIDPALLKVHNDSYIPTDFDVVFTSIGNVFYVTRDDGTFEWNPSNEEIQFLSRFSEDEADNLKDNIFD
ncbi:MAG: XRE family transcriptional regulator, partial [Anaerolineae bacterium]|nr:XRE family transcriptional regulator [Anaerolineae bacterium]